MAYPKEPQVTDSNRIQMLEKALVAAEAECDQALEMLAAADAGQRRLVAMADEAEKERDQAREELREARKLLEWAEQVLLEADLEDAAAVIAHTDILDWLYQHPEVPA